MSSVMTDREKHRSAWISAVFIFCKGAAAISIAVYALCLLYELDMLFLVIGSVFLVCFFGIILFVIKEHVYEEKYGKQPRCNDAGWFENKGEQPTNYNVNVQYTDGRIVWNINPKNLDWSLDIENPIETYRSLKDG